MRWITDIPFYLRYLFTDSEHLNKEPKRKEYVVLSEILADEVTSYCGRYKNRVVKRVNGVDIFSLADVRDAFDKSTDGFITIDFMDVEHNLVLDAEKAAERHQVILEKYQVPAESNLEGTL